LSASATDPDDAGEIVAELLPLVRRFCAGPCAVALGGSIARGTGDALSDVDVYLFADAVLPGEARSEIVRETLGEDARAVSWGRDEELVEGGTDFWHRGRKVECWLRSVASVERAIDAAVRGEVRRDYVFWTVMGFFGHTVLADVRAMRIVEDADGVLARWKARMAEYPEALRLEIVGRYLPEAKFWLENFHYRTAVQRRDVIYTSGIVQQTVHALIQAVFAINREYFPGEKRLGELMRKLPALPPRFVERVEALLHPGGEASVERLEAQRLELAALVAEVERLAGA
jgi:predicted nucleotidyltransferase